MDLLNDDLKSVLEKFGYLGLNLEGGIEIDGRYVGPKAEITPKDLHVIIEAVHRGKSLLQNNSMRITVHEFAAHIPNPDDAYKFMAALTMLKNKSGTRIYYVAPFGNFTSLHYQGLIANAVVPEDEPAKPAKVDALPDAQEKTMKEAVAKGYKPEKEEKKAETPKAAKPEKEEKPKTPRKSAKSETKAPVKRTPRKRNK